MVKIESARSATAYFMLTVIHCFVILQNVVRCSVTFLYDKQLRGTTECNKKNTLSFLKADEISTDCRFPSRHHHPNKKTIYKEDIKIVT